MNTQYTGVDRSPQLRHWKYIKKKRGKNGKWIYYYDKEKLKDDLGFDEREARDKADMASRAARLRANSAYDNYTKGYDITTGSSISNSNSVKENKAIAERAKNTYLKANDEAVKRMDEFVKKHDAYMKTPLGKLENAVNKGKNAIKRLFGLH